MTTNKTTTNKAMQRALAIIFILMVQGLLAGTDYYKVLGISRGASLRQVKKAFRKMSKKYHPDRNSHRPKFAQKKILELNQAYEVLKDEKLRKIYDQGKFISKISKTAIFSHSKFWLIFVQEVKRL